MRFNMKCLFKNIALAGMFLTLSIAQSNAQPQATTVSVGGVNAVLIKPSKPIGSLILLAGGDGRIGVEGSGTIKIQGNQLVRTRMNYAQKGFAVLVPDYGYNLSELVEYMLGIQKPVTVVGTSRGPNLLPPTLVIHHRSDHCKHTLPSGVQDFVSWSKGKSKIVWLDGGEEVGNPCEAQSYHGFRGIDQKVVDLVAEFSR
ncbi:MAG: alpha/beta hydrolase [Gammaproteobacteria bacterium]|nr:alpha/beta hydrolase [Gammaproteobacteria bacterium]